MGLRDYIPSNVRLFASSMMGARTPVDETYFAPDDIAAMRQAAQSGQLRRGAETQQVEERAKYWGSRPPSEVAQQNYSLRDGAPTLTITAGQRAAESNKQLMANRNRPDTIQYEDYPESAIAHVDRAGWLQTAKQSFTNPAFRAATSVGRAVIKKDADGNNILHDTYDWNHGKLFRETPRQDIAQDVIKNVSTPQRLGNMLGNHLVTSDQPTRRQVQVNLGKW